MNKPRQEGLAVIQHYVPKFLLREFSTGKKDQIFVYDKHTQKEYPTNVKNIAAERDFYNYEVDGVEHTLEPKLAALESKAKHVIQQLLRSQNINVLTPLDRTILSMFMAVQFIRTRAAREFMRSAVDGIYEAIKSKGRGDPDWLKAVDTFVGDNLTEARRRQFEVEQVESAPQSFAHHVLAKQWLLCKSDSRHDFILGDHPIGLQNTESHNRPGSLGLASQGIEIFMPLSPRFCLMLICPTVMARLKVLSGRGKGALYDELKLASDVYRCAIMGETLDFVTENVINANSLQIMFSERYVFARSSNFELAREMLRDDPEFRNGRRIAVE
jgi:hypothetical protein